MGDLSTLSTEQLLSLYNQQPSGSPPANPSSMTTEQLLAAYNGGGQQAPASTLLPQQLRLAGEQRVQQQPQDEQPLAWSDVPGQMYKNAPASALEFGSNMVQPFLHPMQTIQNIGDVGSGVAQKLGLASGTEDIPHADAVGKFFSDRYGSMEGFKHALAKDPVGVAGDLSAVFTGGGSLAARAPGILGKVGEAANLAGRVIDPLNAVTKPAALGLRAADVGLGTYTGAGQRNYQIARESGREGGAALDSMTSQMRGTAPIEELVTDARNGAQALREAASRHYRSGMMDISKDKTILSWNDVDTAINDMNKVANFKGQSTSRSTEAVRDKIVSAIDDWKNLRASEYWTPEGFDALKKQIGDIRETIPYEQKAARLVARQAYDAVKDTITKQAPAYGGVMAGYERASGIIREIENTLSVKPNANVDTTLRKLTSSLRNNVNTNFGRREQLVQTLENTGAAPNLTNKIAGQSLNSLQPRGMGNVVSGLGILGHAGTALSTGGLSLAALAPQVALASPRVAGELMRGVGIAQRYGEKLRPLAEPSRQIGRLGNIEIRPVR